MVEWIIALDFKSVLREFESRLSVGIFVFLLIVTIEALTFFQSSKVRGQTRTKEIQKISVKCTYNLKLYLAAA